MKAVGLITQDLLVKRKCYEEQKSFLSRERALLLLTQIQTLEWVLDVTESEYCW